MVVRRIIDMSPPTERSSCTCRRELYTDRNSQSRTVDSPKRDRDKNNDNRNIPTNNYDIRLVIFGALIKMQQNAATPPHVYPKSRDRGRIRKRRRALYYNITRPVDFRFIAHTSCCNQRRIYGCNLQQRHSKNF